MTTHLAARAKHNALPRIQPNMIVRQSRPHRPRVRINPDSSIGMVRTQWSQSSPLWLIVITYAPLGSFRARVWLRPNLDEPYFDKAGYYTLHGAEWGVVGALEAAVREAAKAESDV